MKNSKVNSQEEQKNADVSLNNSNNQFDELNQLNCMNYEIDTRSHPSSAEAMRAMYAAAQETTAVLNAEAAAREEAKAKTNAYLVAQIKIRAEAKKIAYASYIAESVEEILAKDMVEEILAKVLEMGNHSAENIQPDATLAGATDENIPSDHA